jgi:hypothetical protein
LCFVLSGVASYPWRAKGAEKLPAGKKIENSTATAAEEAAATDASPLRGNAYKLEMVKVMIYSAGPRSWSCSHALPIRFLLSQGTRILALSGYACDYLFSFSQEPVRELGYAAFRAPRGQMQGGATQATSLR